MDLSTIPEYLQTLASPVGSCVFLKTEAGEGRFQPGTSPHQRKGGLIGKTEVKCFRERNPISHICEARVKTGQGVASTIDFRNRLSNANNFKPKAHTLKGKLAGRIGLLFKNEMLTEQS